MGPRPLPHPPPSAPRPGAHRGSPAAPPARPPAKRTRQPGPRPPRRPPPAGPHLARPPPAPPPERALPRLQLRPHVPQPLHGAGSAERGGPRISRRGRAAGRQPMAALGAPGGGASRRPGLGPPIRGAPGRGQCGGGGVIAARGGAGRAAADGEAGPSASEAAARPVSAGRLPGTERGARIPGPAARRDAGSGARAVSSCGGDGRRAPRRAERPRPGVDTPGGGGRRIECLPRLEVGRSRTGASSETQGAARPAGGAAAATTQRLLPR